MHAARNVVTPDRLRHDTPRNVFAETFFANATPIALCTHKATSPQYVAQAKTDMLRAACHHQRGLSA